MKAEGIPAAKFKDSNERDKRAPKLAKPPKFAINATTPYFGKFLPNVVHEYGFRDNSYRNRSWVLQKKNVGREDEPEKIKKKIGRRVSEDFYNMFKEEENVENRYMAADVNQRKVARDEDDVKEPRDNVLVMGNDVVQSEVSNAEDEIKTTTTDRIVTDQINNEEKELRNVNIERRHSDGRRSRIREEVFKRYNGLRSYSFTLGANRRCPYLGSPVMSSREQVGLISKTCDIRQPATGWEYTRIIDNRGWIDKMLKDWV